MQNVARSYLKKGGLSSTAISRYGSFLWSNQQSFKKTLFRQCLRFCQSLHFQHQHLMLIKFSSHLLVPLFHKFNCHSLHFQVQYLMLEVSSHQLLVLIVPLTPKINYQVHHLTCQFTWINQFATTKLTNFS